MFRVFSFQSNVQRATEHFFLLYIPEGKVQINYFKMKSKIVFIYYSTENCEINHFWNTMLKLLDKLSYLVTFENKDDHWSVIFLEHLNWRCKHIHWLN